MQHVSALSGHFSVCSVTTEMVSSSATLMWPSGTDEHWSWNFTRCECRSHRYLQCRVWFILQNLLIKQPIQMRSGCFKLCALLLIIFLKKASFSLSLQHWCIDAISVYANNLLLCLRQIDWCQMYYWLRASIKDWSQWRDVKCFEQ